MHDPAAAAEAFAGFTRFLFLGEFLGEVADGLRFPTGPTGCRGEAGGRSADTGFELHIVRFAEVDDRHRRVRHHEVARVGRGDAVLLGEHRHFFDEFFLLAVDADLIEDETDLAPCPQVLDELSAAFGLHGKVNFVDEFFVVLADESHQLDSRVTAATEPPEDDELTAVEEVG